MCFPLSPRPPGSRDPEWRVVFWLAIIFAVMCSLLVMFVFVSSALGCGTVPECLDKTGVGEIFSGMPWLAPLCIGFLIFGVVAAIVGVAFWHAALNPRGYSGQYVRNRRPPQ